MPMTPETVIAMYCLTNSYVISDTHANLYNWNKCFNQHDDDAKSLVDQHDVFLAGEQGVRNKNGC